MKRLNRRVRLALEGLEDRLVLDGTLLGATIDPASVSGEPGLAQESASIPTPGITLTDEPVFVPVQAGPLQPPGGGVTVPALEVPAGSVDLPSLEAALAFSGSSDSGTVSVAEPSTSETAVPVTVGPLSTTITLPVPNAPEATVDAPTPSASAEPSVAVGGDSVLPL